MGKLRAVIRLIRPQQWVKNIFVFTGIIFSGRVSDTVAVLHAVIAFGAFCLISSSIYLLNDIKDVEEDRKHPKKKSRPLASGELPVAVAGLLFLAFAGASLGITYAVLGRSTVVVLATYLVINMGYSFGLKNVVILDVLLIASGFVLRILAGATAISVMPSTWLVLCAVMISVFLGFTKRRAEVVLLGDRASEHRRVLAQYSTAFLDQMIGIVTAGTVVCYILYTVDPHTVELVGSRAMIFSVPLVLYGIFRYLYLVYHAESGGDPTRTVFTDIPLLVDGSIWGVLCTVLILFGRQWGPFLF
jgi:4-hydroxybenzoate polyprenyltransferase